MWIFNSPHGLWLAKASGYTSIPSSCFSEWDVHLDLIATRDPIWVFGQVVPPHYTALNSSSTCWVLTCSYFFLTQGKYTCASERRLIWGQSTAKLLFLKPPPGMPRCPLCLSENMGQAVRQQELWLWDPEKCKCGWAALMARKRQATGFLPAKPPWLCPSSPLDLGNTS